MSGPLPPDCLPKAPRTTAGRRRRGKLQAAWRRILLSWHIVWEEHLLAADAKIGDGLLPLGRDQPIDESLAILDLDGGETGGVHQNDSILVQQGFVALDQYLEIGLVLESKPGRAVAERVCGLADRGVQCGTHAGAGFKIPFAGAGLWIDPGRLPQAQLGL